ncbi:PREDICTED: thyrotropin-releasing hormone-degrading ectoenzyme-like isoform X1 [Trachymyrmex cornetzi]|uniref:thyrotropin-releasing hormone-degrading ectoenzyme-like isoform X1 n=1 Tax=Trachymyrmex cornetzi TaxID=471704 RepID=UPI00084F5796|nr:PREDICTED: thyrotropin-releasing hormone-degrading ectoenzyme-like isoform X1 [Trachymyrmex cornetzi]
MEDNPTQEIPAYVRHRGWQVRTRIAVVILIFVGSMIIYWFVSSSMENRRDGRHRGSTSGKSRKMAHLERLSDQVLPLEYTLKILPILEENNFTMIGDAQIQFYSKVPTKHIRLHARKLLIQDISVKEYRSSNASKLTSTYTVMDDEKDFIDVFLLHVLITEEIYILHIKYMIPLHQKPKGFFRSAHIDHSTNETRWIAVSNFSPDYARSAYPCFDEPWIKTPFRISIGRKSNMRSHSNSMRNFTEEIHGMPGYVWDHYEKTFRMPTYVVAFMVTDFSSYNVTVTDRPSHTIFFRKEIANDTRYVGDLISKILRVVQNFTGFYYELDKLDVIIVPELAYAAMENWGLLTFREDVILIKKDDSIIESKKSIASIAAHEVAHQWFGNLVTPKWWDEVWLKEGFASFFGFLALNAIEPTSWDLQTYFLIECHDVFDNDAGEAAHPLHIDLRKINRLTGVFDLTSYVKGNCVTHMIYHFLGERIFLSSVRHYMRTYHYRNADQEDLWSAFQMEIDEANGLPASSGLRMKDIMRTWTYQAGLPVLHVQQNRETGAIELTQDRFYHYGLNSTSEELWHIPLTWTTENEQQFGNTLPKAWMVKKRMKINDTALSQATSNNQWILFNINQTVLYRVNYDIENWNLLTKSFQALPEVTKVQVLTDSSAMTNAGLLDKRIMWNILEKMEKESGIILWTPALRLLTTIQNRLWNSDLFKFVMCKFINKVYSKIAPMVIYKNPTLWTEFEINLMKSACSVDYQACLTAVLDFDRKMLQNESSNSLPQEFRSWAYCTLMKVTTEEQWLALLKRYNESTVHDKKSLAFALGCHANASLLQRYLSTIYSQKNVTSEFVEIALRSIALNPYGYHVAIQFITQHWNEFNTNTSEGNNYTDVTLIGVLYAFSENIRQKEDIEWLLQLKGKSEKYDTVIEKLINIVQTNVAWYKKEKNETLKILEEISVKYTETIDCKKQS